MFIVPGFLLLVAHIRFTLSLQEIIREDQLLPAALGINLKTRASVRFGET